MFGLIFGFAGAAALAGAGIGYSAGTGFYWPGSDGGNSLYFFLLVAFSLGVGLSVYAFVGWRQEAAAARQRLRSFGEVKELIEQERQAFAASRRLWEQKERSWQEERLKRHAENERWCKVRAAWQAEKTRLVKYVGALKQDLVALKDVDQSKPDDDQRHAAQEAIWREALKNAEAEMEDYRRQCHDGQEYIDSLLAKVQALEADKASWEERGAGAAANVAALERERVEHAAALERERADHAAALEASRARIAELETALAHLQAAHDARTAQDDAAREGGEPDAGTGEPLVTPSQDRLDFLAKVSGALRSPAARIAQVARTSREALPRAALDEIGRLSETFLRKFDDVFDLARVQDGAYRLVLSEVDLDRVVKRLAGDMRPAAEARGVRLVQTGENLGRLKLDERILGRCTSQLLSNAIRFTPRAGRVELSARVIEEAGNRRLAIAVRDTGIGIPPQELDAIFEPFVRNVVRRNDFGEEGLGIGLSLARAFARLHGGTITAASSVGAGSCFTLELPELTGAAVAAPDRHSDFVVTEFIA
jgi:signal transduction histidine kinase